MNCLCVLSMLSVSVLCLWEESHCRNSVLLPQVPGGGGAGGGGGAEGGGREGGGAEGRGGAEGGEGGRRAGGRAGGGEGRGRAGGAGGGEGREEASVLSHPRRRRSWVWNQFFVVEEFTGDEPLYVGKLHSDLDRGDGQVRYVLSGEGAASVFTIDEDTGDIHATKRLDREQQAYYSLRAQARDRTTDLPLEPESRFIIKVQDINDNEPKFLDGPYGAKVAERAPAGTSVVTVVATDADDPTYGNSARLVYSLLQGQPYFSVEPQTGVVRTAVPDLDRELQDRYLLVIQATDMNGQVGGLSGTTSITVTMTDVNDNPPRFLRKSYQFRVPESVLVGSVVAQIRVVDPDLGPNAEVDFRILDGDGLGTFRISTNPETQEGRLTLDQTLDFETRSSYLFRIEVSNRYVDTRFLGAGPFSDVAAVRLLVQNVDEPPVFSPRLGQMAVSEAAPVGTEVGSVSAHDPDASNNPIRYSIDRTMDRDSYFEVDVSSGVIRTTRRLDRETCALHNITVVATETLDRSQVGKAVVLVSVTDVNDNAPSLAGNYQIFVCEDAPPGQVIETLSAVDPDEPGGSHFVFSLLAAGSPSFTLRDNNDNTASILTRRAGFLRQDRLLHFVLVVISDGGAPARSSTNTLTISVCHCDLHGNPRHCSQGASLLPDSLSAAAAAILTAILTGLGLVLVTAAIRHRRAVPLMRDDERDVRENIVRYDDEGGGEEDTEAFNMVALRHLNQTHLSGWVAAAELPPFVTRTPELRTDSNRLFQEFIWDRLQEVDRDLTAPPYDSLQTYAFEGGGSAAGSLSSLGSLSSSESGQSYDFLTEWGPSFGKLADLYAHQEGGGVAS